MGHKHDNMETYWNATYGRCARADIPYGKNTFVCPSNSTGSTRCSFTTAPEVSSVDPTQVPLPSSRAPSVTELSFGSDDTSARTAPVAWASPTISCTSVSESAAYDRRRMAAGGCPSKSVLLGFRFRRRGRLTNAIARAVSHVIPGSREEVGGQSSLSPLQVWRETIQLAGIKVVDIHRVDVSDVSDWLLSLQHEEQTAVISLRVYAHLAAYVAMRPRTRDLVLNLRARAVQKAKEVYEKCPEYSPLLTSWVVPGCVALAMLVLPHEQSSLEFMAGSIGDRANKHTNTVKTGVIDRSYSVRGASSLCPNESWGDWALGLCAGMSVRRGRTLPEDRV